MRKGEGHMAKIFNPVKQWEVFNRYVRMAMARKDIRTQSQLAALLGMERSVVNRRLNSGGWSVEEAWRLIRVLEIGAGDVAVMMASAAA